MADQYGWYNGRLVTQTDMNGFGAKLEQADHDIVVDADAWGIFSGLTVSENGAPNLTVIAAAGLAYSPLGERILTGGPVTVDCAFDRDGDSTEVLASGKSKILSLFLVFDRFASVPQIDAGGQTVFFDLSESFAFEIVQGAEANSPTPPPLRSDAVLLADMTLAYNQTTLVNADISTTRRQDHLVLTGSPFAGRYGTDKAAFQAVFTRYNNHVTGAADQHAGAALTYAGSPNWYDGTPTPAGTMEAGLDAVPSRLASTTNGASGGHSIGLAAMTTWRGGRTRPASSVWAAIEGIGVDLSASLSGDDGAERVGFFPSGNLSATDVHAALVELDTEKGGLGIVNLWTAANTFTGNVTFATPSDVTFGNGCEAFIANGAFMTWQSGGTAVHLDGSIETYADGATINFSGAMAIGATGIFTFSVARTAHRYGIDLIWATGGGTPDASVSAAVPPVITTTVATATGKESLYRLPRGPVGSTLSSVDITTFGNSGSGGGVLTLPTFKLVRWTTATDTASAADDISVATTDVHTSGNFTSLAKTTTVSTNVSVTVSDSYEYGVLITHPWNASIPAAVTIHGIKPNYSLGAPVLTG